MPRDNFPTNDDIEKVFLEARTTFYKQRLGWVYVLGTTLGYYKIGFTNDLTKRFSNFGVKLPFEVWLEEAKLYYDCVWAEKYWHMIFSHLFEKGEWFKLKPRDLDLFHYSESDTEADVKLNILYENNDWLPWDEKIMGELLKDYASFIPVKKKAIKDFFAKFDGKPGGPVSQYRLRRIAELNGPQIDPSEFEKPFDLNKPFNPDEPEG